MFETSVVQSRAIAPQRRASLVSLSLGAHAAAIVGAIALSVAAIDFPTSVPRQMSMFQVAGPPPLGNPLGGKPPETKPKEQPPQKAEIVQPPTVQTAPRDVTTDTPATTTTSVSNANNDVALDGPPGPGLVDEPFGRSDGKKGGIGDIDQPPVVDAVPEPKIHQPGIGEVKPARVLGRVDPVYPNIMRTMRMSATVRIHCVIGSDGRVRDPRIVVSSYPPFNNSVLSALQQWTFAPGTLRGQPVDTYFDLTVTFSVK